MNPDADLRIRALDLATLCGEAGPAQVVARAEAYLAFLAPTPREPRTIVHVVEGVTSSGCGAPLDVDKIRRRIRDALDGWEAMP